MPVALLYDSKRDKVQKEWSQIWTGVGMFVIYTKSTCVKADEKTSRPSANASTSFLVYSCFRIYHMSASVTHTMHFH